MREPSCGTARQRREQNYKQYQQFYQLYKQFIDKIVDNLFMIFLGKSLRTSRKKNDFYIR